MENRKPLTILLLLLLFPLLRSFPPSSAVSDEELEAAIYSLRSRGYHLFGNAITSSDIRFDMLCSNDSFTLFAPTDAALFSIDMVFSAAAYVDVLRHHIALGRHSLPVLCALIPGTSIPTLLPSNEILVSYRESADLITIDGVYIVLPSLFYGQHIAVHGLAGILTHRTIQPSETLPTFRSQDSRYAPADSPDLSKLRPAASKERRRTKRETAGLLAPMTHHNLAPASGFTYPPLQPQIPRTPSGSPDLLPAITPSGSSSCILISPAMHPIANGMSQCSSTAEPAAFSSACGTCGNAHDLCAPANHSTNEDEQT